MKIYITNSRPSEPFDGYGHILFLPCFAFGYGKTRSWTIHIGWLYSVLNIEFKRKRK